MAKSAPIKLHFEDFGKWYSLPEWAEYFLSIGKELAFASQSGSRVVTAIVIPTRAYGAAFVSLGMVIANAASRGQASETAHFERLFDLPPGSQVIYRHRPDKVLKGVLQEPEEIDNKLWIRIQVHSKKGDGLTYLVDESKASQVQPACYPGKLPKKQGGNNMRLANAFVDQLLGNADPVQLGLCSRLVCAIVGRKNTIEHEIRKTPLAIHVNGRHYVDGVLQDVLRMNQFVLAGQTYRTAAIPVGSNSSSEETFKNIETGIIFDGAPSFLKWGEMNHNCHQVVILDRTEPYLEEAINAINVKFSQKRVDGETILPKCDAPPGGEIIAFREAVK